MKKNSIKIFVSAFLPWIQLLQVYGFVSGITYGYIGIIISIVLLLLIHNDKKHPNTNVSKGLLIYFAIALIMLPVSVLFSSEIMFVNILNRLIKLFSVFFLIYLFYKKGIDFSVYFKSLRILTYIACLAVIYQFISYNVLGHYYSFKIPFLKYANSDTDAKYGYIEYTNRFGSIFTEPSHFAYFVFQYFILRMFVNSKSRAVKLFELLLISLCIILSISSSGIVLLAITWVLYVLWGEKNQPKQNSSNLYKFVVVLILGVSALLFLKNSNLSFALYRLTGDYDRADVVWKRLYSNLDRVLSLDKTSLLFGLGMGNIESAFMNSFIYLVLTTGLVGMVLISLWMLFIFFKVDYLGKTLIIVLALLMMIDMCFYTPTLLGYCVPLIYCCKDLKGDYKSERCCFYNC